MGRPYSNRDNNFLTESDFNLFHLYYFLLKIGRIRGVLDFKSRLPTAAANDIFYQSMVRNCLIDSMTNNTIEILTLLINCCHFSASICLTQEKRCKVVICVNKELL